MLNFISLFNEEEDIVLLALGLRGFFFSLFLKRKFQLCVPYIGQLMRISFIRKLYFYFLHHLYKPNVVWLYGGGEIASEILRMRHIFGKETKFILRSAGEDIQYSSDLKYGIPDNSARKKNLKKNYLKADYFWSLSSEITELYKNFGIPPKKIQQIGNLVKIPIKISKTKNKKITIGIIGRNHPKKQFGLAVDVAKSLQDSNFNFIFKTPKFNVPTNILNIKKHTETKINNLSFWPPLDVWEFYAQCDAILITSAIESFGNVTIEAGLSGCGIIMSKNVTGYQIAKDLGFQVIGFSEFSVENITAAINKFEPEFVHQNPQSLNESFLIDFIKLVKSE